MDVCVHRQRAVIQNECLHAYGAYHRHTATNFLSLQASLAEAEQETLEDAMTTNQERHYVNTAAECKVSSQTIQAFLDDITLSTHKSDTESADKTAIELLPSASIHRLGLGIPDLTLLAC